MSERFESTHPTYSAACSIACVSVLWRVRLVCSLRSTHCNCDEGQDVRGAVVVAGATGAAGVGVVLSVSTVRAVQTRAL